MSIRARFRDTESFDGTRLSWTSSGSGDVAVIFANGIVCSDTYWTFLYPYLAKRGHRVIFWDYRAHGRSDMPANPNEVSISAHARDLWAVADAAGVKQAVLVGHSMGVQTILEAYRLAPERVAAMVAIAGAFEHPIKTFYGAPFGHYLLPFMELSVMPIPGVTRALWRTLTEQGALMYWTGRVSQMIGGEASRELMEEYFTHVSTLDPVLVFRMVRAMSDHSARDVLPKVTVPTLVLAGAHDVMTPPSLATKMAELIPDAQVEVHADGAHTLPIDDPDWVNRHVDDFVRGLLPATSRK